MMDQNIDRGMWFNITLIVIVAIVGITVGGMIIMSSGLMNKASEDTNYVQPGENSLRINYALDESDFWQGRSLVYEVQQNTAYSLPYDKPQRNNFVFSHWEANGVRYNPGDTISKVLTTITFKPIFTPVPEYDITIQLNGGVIEGGYENKLKQGSVYVLPLTIPTKSGFEFTHYEYQSKRYNPGDEIHGLTQNTTINAVFRELARYTITLNVPDGLIGTETTWTTTIEEGKKFIFTDMHIPTSLQPNMFSHWETPGDTTRYTSGVELIPVRNMEFVAVWK